MEFIAEAVGMQKFSNEHFRLCVFAFDAAHIVTACFYRVHICHRIKVSLLFIPLPIFSP